MSEIVERAIQSAGLGDLVAARRGGLSPEQVARLRSADLLVLGALSDHVRAEEVGPNVTIYVAEPPADGRPRVVFPVPAASFTGFDLLREVAVARISGPRGLRVRLDWTAAGGLELAQVALGFGVDELVGRIANKRGLPLEEGELLGVGKKSRHELARDVKRRELAACVRRTGRVPVFVGPDGCAEREVDR